MKSPQHEARRENSSPRIVFAILLAACGLCHAQPEELTKVAAVRALGSAEVFVKHPVRLRGVLVADQFRGRMVIQDETACIRVVADEKLCEGLLRGDLVETRGMAVPGGFAPSVEADQVERLGTAPVPPPVRVSFEDLRSGRYDAQSVEIEGIVRQAAGRSVDFAVDGGRVRAFFRLPGDAKVPVDARIRVQGVALNQFTRSGQPLHPVLSVSNGLIPKVITPPPLKVPLRRVDRLMSFSDKLDHGHRVCIRGVVTHQQAGEALWLDDDGHGIRVRFGDSSVYAVGEVLEILGFPVWGGSYTPELEDVAIKRIAHGRPANPLLLGTSTAALDHDAGLIALDARVVELMKVPQGLRLILRDKQRDFIALLRCANFTPPDAWQPGSLVRVTGICQVSAVPMAHAFGTVQPKEFDLVLRTPADIGVLKTAPWWNAERQSRFFAGITLFMGIAMLALFWIWRRKHRQSAIARREAQKEFAAVLGERSRIAREIHDTIAQGLGAVLLRHELAKDHVAPGSEAETHLLEANEITRDCLTEARESIWNMRSQILEDHDLPTALAAVLDQLTDRSGIDADFDLQDDPVRLPPIVENNLLRIGQEAITNAVNHSSARTIQVTLEYSPRQVTLRVRDDGCGFDPETVQSKGNHFGLIGLRERSNELKATLRFVSSPGEGTEVVLEYPLPNRIPKP